MYILPAINRNVIDFEILLNYGPNDLKFLISSFFIMWHKFNLRKFILELFCKIEFIVYLLSSQPNMLFHSSHI